MCIKINFIFMNFYEIEKCYDDWAPINQWILCLLLSTLYLKLRKTYQYHENFQGTVNTCTVIFLSLDPLKLHPLPTQLATWDHSLCITWRPTHHGL